MSREHINPKMKAFINYTSKITDHVKYIQDAMLRNLHSQDPNKDIDPL